MVEQGFGARLIRRDILERRITNLKDIPLEHHFVTHFRDAIDYEIGIKERLIAEGNGGRFLEETINFYHSIENIVFGNNPTIEELNFVHDSATFFLTNGNYYNGIMLAQVIKRLDYWLVDHDESFFHRSLWGKFGRKF